MKDRQFEDKLRQDVAKVKEDLNTLAESSAARFGKIEGNVSQVTGKVKENVTTWVDDGATQLSEGFEKLTGEAKETAARAAVTVKKEVGEGLIQYNAKAQQVANKVSSDLSEKAAQYPWASITIAVALGFLLGISLTRRKK